MWTAAAAALATLSLAASPTPGPLDWVEDDWAAAAARARAEGKQTVAVDVWATWCHTCLSMKHFVLTEPEMAKVADRHVWLSLDFDLEKNAAFFERHPVSAFPTFLVLDAKTEQVVARWVGSGSVEEMRRFFERARRGDDPLSRGQRALAEKRTEAASALFEAALAKGVVDPSLRTRLLLGWVEAQYELDKETCAKEGKGRLRQTDDSTQGADFAAMVAYCASSLSNEAEKKAVMKAVAARLAPLAANPKAPLAVDDRSSVYGILEMAYAALGQPKKAEAAVKARLALLERAAKAATTPAARATFDYHRMQAYLRLNRPEAAIRMLDASEAAQPRDFNHPWRLAKVYLHTKDHEAGLAAIDRAISRGYGGRILRLYSTRIDLQLAAGANAAAKQTVEAARARLAKLSEAQVRPFWRSEFEARAARVSKATR